MKEYNTYWLTKKRFFNKSILFVLNFFLIQWFFTRLAVEISDDSVIEGFSLLKPVLPITGWFGINYIYIFRGKKK